MSAATLHFEPRWVVMALYVSLRAAAGLLTQYDGRCAGAYCPETRNTLTLRRRSS